MRLSGQLAQSRLGLIKGIALGTECGITQTWRLETFRVSRTVWARSARITTAVAPIPCITATGTSGVLAVAKLATAPHRGWLFFFHAGTVIPTHSHHTFGCHNRFDRFGYHLGPCVCFRIAICLRIRCARRDIWCRPVCLC